VGITWEDAPEEQNAVIDRDYKVRCVVRASPPATIDWLKDSLVISTGERVSSIFNAEEMPLVGKRGGKSLFLKEKRVLLSLYPFLSRRF